MVFQLLTGSLDLPLMRFSLLPLMKMQQGTCKNNETLPIQGSELFFVLSTGRVHCFSCLDTLFYTLPVEQFSRSGTVSTDIARSALKIYFAQKVRDHC